MQPLHPTMFVIFGVTGDLGTRKLIPALFELHSRKLLNEQFTLIGFSRRGFSNEEFKEFLKDTIKKSVRSAKRGDIQSFIERAHFTQGVFEETEHYGKLSELLVKLDGERGLCTNKLFYLSTPPEFYETILKNLADSGLTVPCSDETGWTRVLVEKPFGRDIETAQKLDKLLGLLFKEEQIFRIDHYLAKETAQNILMFRFSNALFEPLFDSKNVEKIEIKLLESKGIDFRGNFYDGVGALRDVGQNHMLQLLALIAMENPRGGKDINIRDARASVLEKVECTQNSKDSFARAQFRGYRSVDGVDPNSRTETYFRIEARIGNDRWRGVPFYLESGKALLEDMTEVSVHFSSGGTCLCPEKEEGHKHANVLTFRVQPNEGISIIFWSKKAGLSSELEPRNLHFNYKDAKQGGEILDAYIKIIYDAIEGDQTLFASTREVIASWKFITSVLEVWSDLPLLEYDKDINPSEIK